ncbi:hypothetical protein Golob_009157, partial [Gossypium lobatum]|nr:hypothetical protein [Gossypium lobatum]
IITSSQIDVSSSRKAVVIHVPYRLSKAFRRVHVKLVMELEKKFNGKVGVVSCSSHWGFKISSYLPRLSGSVDGLKMNKVYLHPKERNNTEYKLETFSTVYRKLAGKDVVFELPGTVA